MRARLAIAICLVAVLLASLAPAATAGGLEPGARGVVVVAQQEESEEQGEGGGDPSQETGAGEGETEGGSSETGPPWTYQMARMSVILLLLLMVSIGWVYFKLVVRRRRGEI